MKGEKTMLKSEFIKYAGYEPTQDDYAMIEQVYYAHEGDKNMFCEQWKNIPVEMQQAIIGALSDVYSSYHHTTNKSKVQEQQIKALNECLGDEITKRIAAQEKLNAIENILK